MPHINELTDILYEYFPWNKARLSCFASMLIALFAVRTVNLTQIACALSGEAKESSRYRRVQRFFSEFEFDYPQDSQFYFQTVFIRARAVVLNHGQDELAVGKEKHQHIDVGGRLQRNRSSNIVETA